MGCWRPKQAEAAVEALLSQHSGCNIRPGRLQQTTAGRVPHRAGQTPLREGVEGRLTAAVGQQAGRPGLRQHRGDNGPVLPLQDVLWPVLAYPGLRRQDWAGTAGWTGVALQATGGCRHPGSDGLRSGELGEVSQLVRLSG